MNNNNEKDVEQATKRLSEASERLEKVGAKTVGVIGGANAPVPWDKATVEEKLDRCREAIKLETFQRRRTENQVLEKIELLEQHSHNAGDGGKMVIPYEQTRRRIYPEDRIATHVDPGHEYF